MASADPIRLTDGFLEITSSEQGRVEVFGERGFSLLADVDVSQGRFDPWTQCNHMSACAPGMEIGLEASFIGTPLRNGVLTFEGQSYPMAGGVNAATFANLLFSGSVTAPPAAPSALVTAPFEFTGLFSIADESGLPQQGPPLRGEGIVTLNLGFSTAFSSWVVESARYDFTEAAAPVPEPGTMLLVGLGIAGVARRAARARAKAA